MVVKGGDEMIDQYDFYVWLQKKGKNQIKKEIEKLIDEYIEDVIKINKDRLNI